MLIKWFKYIKVNFYLQALKNDSWILLMNMDVSLLRKHIILFFFPGKKKKKKEPCFSGEKIRNAAFSTQTAIFG